MAAYSARRVPPGSRRPGWRAGGDAGAGAGIWGRGGEGPLGEAGPARRYTATRVLARWTTVRPGYRIVLRGGTELVASAEHRFLTERGWTFTTPRGRRRAL